MGESGELGGPVCAPRPPRDCPLLWRCSLRSCQLFINPSLLRHARRKCDSYDRHNLYCPSTADFELDTLALPHSTEEIQRFELVSERERSAVNGRDDVLRLHTCLLCRAAVRDLANEEPDHAARSKCLSRCTCS